ncbi:MAG: glycosyltransferase family 4 protein, partial [Terrimicrobiaceae bacterium]
PSLAARHSPPTTVPVVLVVANVDARKNQNAFIRAIEPLAASNKFEVRFFGRCGDDEYGRDFQSLVAARPWCHYGGMISRGALRDEFALASFLALPTHEDNCPMVVLEAQAAGIPVMVSNVGGVPDLVEHEVTGLLTDPPRPETMLNALSRLLTDQPLASHLAKNGRRQALEKFHPRVIAERHLEVYREVVRRAKI